MEIVSDSRSKVTYAKHHSNFIKTVSNFFMQQYYSDMVFICKKNVQVKAHKIILASVSDFISGIVSANYYEEVMYISVPDVDHKKLQLLLTVIYKGVVRVHCEDMEILKELSHFLNIPLKNAAFVVVNSNTNSLVDDYVEHVNNVTVNENSDEHNFSLIPTTEEPSDCESTVDKIVLSGEPPELLNEARLPTSSEESFVNSDPPVLQKETSPPKSLPKKHFKKPPVLLKEKWVSTETPNKNRLLLRRIRQHSVESYRENSFDRSEQQKGRKIFETLTNEDSNNVSLLPKGKRLAVKSTGQSSLRHFRFLRSLVDRRIQRSPIGHRIQKSPADHRILRSPADYRIPGPSADHRISRSSADHRIPRSPADLRIPRSPADYGIPGPPADYRIPGPSVDVLNEEFVNPPVLQRETLLHEPTEESLNNPDILKNKKMPWATSSEDDFVGMPMLQKEKRLCADSANQSFISSNTREADPVLSSASLGQPLSSAVTSDVNQTSECNSSGSDTTRLVEQDPLSQGQQEAIGGESNDSNIAASQVNVSKAGPQTTDAVQLNSSTTQHVDKSPSCDIQQEAFSEKPANSSTDVSRVNSPASETPEAPAVVQAENNLRVSKPWWNNTKRVILEEVYNNFGCKIPNKKTRENLVECLRLPLGSINAWFRKRNKDVAGNRPLVYKTSPLPLASVAKRKSMKGGLMASTSTSVSDVNTPYINHQSESMAHTAPENTQQFGTLDIPALNTVLEQYEMSTVNPNSQVNGYMESVDQTCQRREKLKLSDQQENILLQEYKKNKFPRKKELMEIAGKLNLTFDRVYRWFYYRRAKTEKEFNEEELQILEDSFRQHRVMTKEVVKELSTLLVAPRDAVVQWFIARRSRKIPGFRGWPVEEPSTSQISATEENSLQSDEETSAPQITEETSSLPAEHAICDEEDTLLSERLQSSVSSSKKQQSSVLSERQQSSISSSKRQQSSVSSERQQSSSTSSLDKQQSSVLSSERQQSSSISSLDKHQTSVLSSETQHSSVSSDRQQSSILSSSSDRQQSSLLSSETQHSSVSSERQQSSVSTRGLANKNVAATPLSQRKNKEKDEQQRVLSREYRRNSSTSIEEQKKIARELNLPYELVMPCRNKKGKERDSLFTEQEVIILEYTFRNQGIIKKDDVKKLSILFSKPKQAIEQWFIQACFRKTQGFKNFVPETEPSTSSQILFIEQTSSAQEQIFTSPLYLTDEVFLVPAEHCETPIADETPLLFQHPSRISQSSPVYVPHSSPAYVRQPSPLYIHRRSPVYVPPSSPGYMPSPSPVYIPPSSPGYMTSPSPVYVPPSSPGYMPSPSPVYVPPSSPGYMPSPSPVYVPPSSPGYVSQPSPAYLSQPSPMNSKLGNNNSLQEVSKYTIVKDEIVEDFKCLENTHDLLIGNSDEAGYSGSQTFTTSCNSGIPTSRNGSFKFERYLAIRNDVEHTHVGEDENEVEHAHVGEDENSVEDSCIEEN